MYRKQGYDLIRPDQEVRGAPPNFLSTNTALHTFGSWGGYRSGGGDIFAIQWIIASFDYGVVFKYKWEKIMCTRS